MSTSVLRECDPIAPLQRRHMKSCIDAKQCQADAQAANEKLDGCPTQSSPSGLLYTSRPSYCFINLCSIMTAVDLQTAFGVPTIVFETLTNQDFTNEKPASQPCVFND